MMNMSESVNANRMMYREWFPAIMYNHHQTGPAGAVLFAPPFRDPFNYNFDPLIPLGIDMVGAAIHTRLAVEGQAGRGDAHRARRTRPGSTAASARRSYFHNQIGILTETIGNPTPVEIPVRPRHAAAARRRAEPDRAADVPLPTVDRVFGHQQLRDPRHRVEAEGRLPLQHVQDGEERDRQGQAATTGRSIRSGSKRRVRRSRPSSRQLPRRRDIGPRGGRGGGFGRGGAPIGSTTTSCTIRRCAIRAASSCRPISPTSSPRRSSSTP